MNIEKSTLINNFITEARGKAYTYNAFDTLVLVKTLFAGTSDYLKQVKAKETPVAAVINDLKGNFIMGAMVSYNKNEDETNPDNWNLIWTFDEKDLEGAMKRSLMDLQVLPILNARMNHDANGGIPDPSSAIQSYTLLAKCIKDYLIQNAVDEKPHELELEGYFTMFAAKEGDKIQLAIEPDGNMSKLIKDDSAVEVA